MLILWTRILNYVLATAVTFPCLFEDMADILPKYLFVCLNKKRHDKARGQA